MTDVLHAAQDVQTGASTSLIHSVCLSVVILCTGVATAVVGEKGEGTIQIVKRGTAIIDRAELTEPQSWGTYSAGQVYAGKLWFAVSIPEEDQDTQMVKHGSWVGAVSLNDYQY